MKLQLWYPIKPFVVTQKFGRENTDPSLFPVYAKMCSGTYCLEGHNGWDMVGSVGQACRVAHNGTVVYAGEDALGGLGVVVRTKDKFDWNGEEVFFKSIYWHLLPGSIVVKVGQQVSVGDKIALCDTTPPNIKPHLHFGIKAEKLGEDNWTWFNIEQKNGYLGAVDPEPYWSGLSAEDYVSISNQIKIIALKISELWKIIFKK